MEKTILDACCGSKMFWFDKENPNVIFGDKRTESHVLCDGRSLEIKPDIEMDFRDMPFEDESFYLVVMDVPHLITLGKKSWMALKYGVLENDWPIDLKLGVDEAFRVLKPNGILIFKWNEIEIPVSSLLKAIERQPLFGHKSGKRSDTHWLTFIKQQ